MKKEITPLFYKSIDDLDKPVSELISDIRDELCKVRGKIGEITVAHGCLDRVGIYENGITCLVAGLYGVEKYFEEVENIKKYTSSLKDERC